MALSILTYSLVTGFGYFAQNPVHLAMIRFVKGSDPTRPVLMPQQAQEFLPPEVDILAPHYRPPSAMDQLAAHSDRVVIATEYTHAYAEEGFGGLLDSWRALTRHPSGAGGSIWMWQDQGLTRTRTNAAGVQEKYIHIVPDGWDGIVTADRRHLTAAHLRQAGITEDMRVHITGIEDSGEFSKVRPDAVYGLRLAGNFATLSWLNARILPWMWAAIVPT